MRDGGKERNKEVEIAQCDVRGKAETGGIQRASLYRLMRETLPVESSVLFLNQTGPVRPQVLPATT